MNSISRMVTRRRKVHAIVLSGGAVTVDLALPVSGTAAGSRMPVADAGPSPATGSQSLSASASGQARFKVVLSSPGAPATAGTEGHQRAAARTHWRQLCATCALQCRLCCLGMVNLDGIVPQCTDGHRPRLAEGRPPGLERSRECGPRRRSPLRTRTLLSDPNLECNFGFSGLPVSSAK